MCKRLFILVEGSDDLRLADNILTPIFENASYDHVQTYPYAERTKREITNLIRSVNAMGADVICLADIDDSPCVTARKEEIAKGKLEHVNINRVAVVIKEIESWYLAGLDDKCCKELGLPHFVTTCNIDKEQFNNCIYGSKYDSRTDCMIEILKRFNVSIARLQNSSFDYFCGKYI